MIKNIFSVFAAIAITAFLVPAPASAFPEAAEHSRVIFLGSAIDPHSDKLVEGYAIIHFRKGVGPDGNINPKSGIAKGGKSGDKKGGGKSPKCFSFLANGAKWKSVEPWLVNPANTSGLSSNFVFTTIADGILKWEDAADGAVGDGGAINILGNGSVTAAALVADLSAPDGQNEVYFSDPGSSAIAITIVWGIFGGPPSGRELVEWDQIYNDADYGWSANGEPNKMDLDNIVTHELGHSFGLDDLYTLSCAGETMYGYADFGETNKRTLEAGDIDGISSLY